MFSINFYFGQFSIDIYMPYHSDRVAAHEIHISVRDILEFDEKITKKLLKVQTETSDSKFSIWEYLFDL